MKLTEAETKKALYSLLGVVAFVLLASALVLSPIQSKRTAAKAELSSLTDQLTTAVQQVKAAERDATVRGVIQASLAVLEQGQQAGAPIAWLPAQLERYFTAHAVTVGKIKLINEVQGPTTSEWKTILWTVEVPSASYEELGQAVAALENEWPTIEVTGLDVLSALGDNTRISATLTLTLLVKPEVKPEGPKA